MNPYLKKTIVVGCLGAFAWETYELTLKSEPGHALPSTPFTSFVVSSASSTTTFTDVTSFPSAITEAVYPNVPDIKVLKSDGQTEPTPKA